MRYNILLNHQDFISIKVPCSHSFGVKNFFYLTNIQDFSYLYLLEKGRSTLVFKLISYLIRSSGYIGRYKDDFWCKKINCPQDKIVGAFLKTFFIIRSWLYKSPLNTWFDEKEHFLEYESLCNCLSDDASNFW